MKQNKRHLKLFSKLSVALIVTAGMVVAPLLHQSSAEAATSYLATISQTPEDFATIEGTGEVLTTALATYDGKKVILVGGKFQQLRTPDGVVYNASNFAILNLANKNEVLYAGTGIDGFVRTVYYNNNTIYIGGDFTTVNGVARSRVAAFNTSYQLLNWNPTTGGSIRTIVANNNAVFYGGFGSKFRAVQTPAGASPGALIWEKTFTEGAVRTAILHPNLTDLYVGGLFETFGGVAQHGLVKVSAATGANNATFKPVFKADTTPDGYDGDCILSLSYDPLFNKLAVGSGGSYRNQMWYMDSNTGSVTNANWVVSGYATNASRNSEGDVQAIAMIRDKIATGYHRSHANLKKYPNGTPVPTKRFMTLWKSFDAELQTWDSGLWGNNNTANDTNANGGVQSFSYNPAVTQSYLVVGGTFKGYNKPYLNNNTQDDIFGNTAGPTGVTRNGLQVYNVHITTTTRG